MYKYLLSDKDLITTLIGGLEFHKGSLIANQPKIGVVSGDQFIYLANAQLANGFQEGKLRPK